MPYLRKAVKTEAPSACFFCDYVPDPRQDRKNLVLHRGKGVFAVLNRYPYTGGHLMVAPYAHQGELERLAPATRAELMDVGLRMKGVLTKVMRPDGFNLGINLGRPAGAGVPGHVHLHVPRWNGDTNFMTTVGNVKVIPQALLEMYDELRSAL
jgi:ATP adenylyltransferase